MKDNEDLRKTYNKIAEDWNTDHEKDDWWVNAADTFLAMLFPGAKILDIGCAGGNKTEYIKQKGFSVAGVDFSENMIQNARDRFPDIDFKVWDVYEIDKYPGKFDGIFCQALLLHIPKKKVLEVLEKIKSKLNDNGLILIAVKEKKDGGNEEEIRKDNDYGFEYERFFSYFTVDEIKDCFKSVGLKVVYEDIAPPSRIIRKTNWIQIIGKK